MKISGFKLLFYGLWRRVVSLVINNVSKDYAPPIFIPKTKASGFSETFVFTNNNLRDLSNSKKQDYGATSRSVAEDYPNILRDHEIRYFVHKSQAVISILMRINSVHTNTTNHIYLRSILTLASRLRPGLLDSLLSSESRIL
jgi:hypothetical protein